MLTLSQKKTARALLMAGLGAGAVIAMLAARQPDRTPAADRATVASSPEAVVAEEVVLEDGASFAMTASEVIKRIGAVPNAMLAYNGSIPGPTFRVKQGSEVNIDFKNQLDEPTTVHWHGVRVTNGNDGTPATHEHDAGTAPHRDDASLLPPPVAPGGSFEYQLRFPDPGAYWYHPHVREDKQQDRGMYGMIIVEPATTGYWPEADTEQTLVLDDVLASKGFLAPHHDDLTDFALMGRYGNTYLTNGETQPEIAAEAGKTVRLYVVNAANARPFRLAIEGAEMTLVGSDGGRIPEPQPVQHVTLGPSERAVLNVTFDRSGSHGFFNDTPAGKTRLGTFAVTGTQANDASVAGPADKDDFAGIRTQLGMAVDHTWKFDVTMSHAMPGMNHGTHGDDGIEWEDTMGMMNAHMTQKSTTWKIIDEATGRENMNIETAWQTGEYRKIRLVNPADGNHAMQHPFHIHGQRFVVSAVDGKPNADLAWKDTVLVPAGSVVDIVVEVSNPGEWMAHCHIAEHLASSMMTMIRVSGPDRVPAGR